MSICWQRLSLNNAEVLQQQRRTWHFSSVLRSANCSSSDTSPTTSRELTRFGVTTLETLGRTGAGENVTPGGPYEVGEGAYAKAGTMLAAATVSAVAELAAELHEGEADSERTLARPRPRLVAGTATAAVA